MVHTTTNTKPTVPEPKRAEQTVPEPILQLPTRPESHQALRLLNDYAIARRSGHDTSSITQQLYTLGYVLIESPHIGLYGTLELERLPAEEDRNGEESPNNPCVPHTLKGAPTL